MNILQKFSQDANCPEHTQLNRAHGATQGRRHFFIRTFLDQRQGRGNTEFGRQPVKGPPDLITKLALQRRIWTPWLRNVFRQFNLRPAPPEIIQGYVGGDPACPRASAATGIKPGASAIHSPEGFQRQVLGGGVIADNSHNPAIDFALKLSKDDFEGLQIPSRESLQHVHAAPYYVLLPG